MKKSGILLLSFTFLACTAYKLYEPTDADVERNKNKFDNLTLLELKEGKKLYQSNCNLCHKLFSPSSFSDERWKEIVPIMTKKVNARIASNTITRADEEKIIKYLIIARDKH